MGTYYIVKDAPAKVKGMADSEVKRLGLPALVGKVIQSAALSGDELKLIAAGAVALVTGVRVLKATTLHQGRRVIELEPDQTHYEDGSVETLEDGTQRPRKREVTLDTFSPFIPELLGAGHIFVVAGDAITVAPGDAKVNPQGSVGLVTDPGKEKTEE